MRKRERPLLTSPTLALLLAVPLPRTAAAQQEREITPEFHVHHVSTFEHPRDVLVWLPPGYDTEPERRYPTLYMHDGAGPFIAWRIDEIAKRLIASKAMEPVIIVLIPNDGTSEGRFNDYTPTLMRGAKAGGHAAAYGRALVEELKPLVDAKYRTLPDPAHTGVGGASLGGLASLYLALKYPAVFGKVVVLSPAIWWDDKLIVRLVQDLRSKPPLRIWLDVGKKEPGSAIRDARELRDALVKQGWKLDEDLAYAEIEGATHDEASFARRAEPFLKYLYSTSGLP